MDITKFILASLIGGVVLFLLGGLFYAVLFMDYFNAVAAPGVYKAEPVMWSILIGELFAGAFLSLIFTRWASIKTFVTGLKNGALIGIILGLGMGFTFYGAANMYDIPSMLFDAVLGAIRFGIAGGFIGWFLGRK
jgi:hypothetical protein